eukprot:TRINITY_DN3945_c1_g1_i1.p1 TRINITY_DN3945_c1_g1~~TRINITY_DN3945_c1_g1_i1.p1  ORF type:complete len:517 (+),score=179.33 TRINITY_DN3945_c1_g1_i1:178-1551(+)
MEVVEKEKKKTVAKKASASASPKKKKKTTTPASPKKAKAKPTPKSPRVAIKAAVKPVPDASKEKRAEEKKAAVVKAKSQAINAARLELFSGTLAKPVAAASSSSSSSSSNEAMKDELLKSFKAGQVGPVKGVDVVFSFDTTCSMRGYLDQVKKNLQDIITKLLKDLPTIRVGILCHGDYHSKHIYLTASKDLSRDVDEMVKFIQGVQVTNGGDIAECYELALRECSRNMTWSPEHSKALVVIGDAYPHSPAKNPERIDWEEEVAELNKKGVKIYSVQCGSDQTSTKFFSTMADVTGGSHLFLKDMMLISDMFMAVCYREGYEMELASNPVLYEGILDDLNKEIESLGVEGGAARLLRPDESREAIALSNEDMLKVHAAIHGGDDKVELFGASYPVSWGTYGNRFVRVNEHGLLFIQQNIERNTSYAQMAREGKKITWMCKEGKWGVIVNDTIDKKIE